MYEVFGEFDSAEEMNQAAEGLKNEGDESSLYILAKENGIEVELAKMYYAGMMPYLCDIAMAAVGKLQAEAEQLEVKELIADWVEYTKVQCFENEEFAKAVRRKGKSLKGCIAAILKWSFTARYKLDADIVKEAKIGNAKVEMGIPGMRTAKKLIQEYYLGK